MKKLDMRTEPSSLKTVMKQFEGKSIALVGGSSSIFGTKYGEKIDAADLVIRMNRSFPKRRKDQGHKTDLLTLSCDFKRWQHWYYYNSSPIMWMSPKREALPKWIEKWHDLHFYPEDYWNTLFVELNEHRPSTGAMTFDLICNYINPQKLDLYGFDFKKSKTLYQKKQKLGSHNWELEKQYTRDKIEQARSTGRDWTINQ